MYTQFSKKLNFAGASKDTPNYFDIYFVLLFLQINSG